MFLLRLIVPVILLSLIVSAHASLSRDDSSMEEDAVLEEIKTPEGREGIQAKIMIPAPRRIVRAVITDYEKLAEFIPDMKSSKVVERKGSEVILSQKGESRFLMFRFDVEVVMKLLEQPDKIGFSLVSGDFDYFEGEWKTASIGDQETLLIYTLVARPKFYAPKWVVRYMLKRDIPVRLRALRNRVLQINNAK